MASNHGSTRALEAKAGIARSRGAQGHVARMSYENPPVPHEVNVSRESTLAQFLRLCAGLAVVIALASAVLWVAGGWLARLVPYSTERSMVGARVFGLDLLGEGDAAGDPADHARIEAYLQSLASRLGAVMELPEGMAPIAHFAEADLPNAFATLGGHLIVTRGLYRRMPSENALALVLAHEIGHLRARDPISAIGGGASVALLMALLAGDGHALLPQFARLVTLGYSRQVERRADDAALEAVIALYGHARGSEAVFRILAEHRGPAGLGEGPTLFSTHPADAARIARMEAAAAAAGADAVLTPLQVAAREP